MHKKQKVKIPLGVWDLEGNWFPNTRLKMSEKEQKEYNEKNGYSTQSRKSNA